ncbi:MAG TPA: VWA domain-containing protein [Myxococcaceae bacterium]|nr:VWA domain-containing protein [Myxococcaceae bacterium]
MDARIVEFAEVLRQNGVRVSPSEVQDAARAAAAVGVGDRGSFRAALRATMVKRALDEEVFARAFEFFFSGAARLLEAVDESLARRIEEEGLLDGEELKALLAALGDLARGFSPLTEAALAGDRGRLAGIFRGASLQLDLSRLETPLQAGFFSRRLLSAAGAAGMESDLRTLEAELRARGLSEGALEIVSGRLSDLLRRVEDAARREIERQTRARLRRAPGATLLERDFQTLSRDELERMELAVRRLAERLKTRLVRKQRSRRRGQLNVRRTLRENLTWGAVPMVPWFRRRRAHRPEVVVLCDVSDSVRNVSRVMLLFTYTLQSLFSRVRSFVFVSDIGEVTDHFRELAVEQAVDVAVAGQRISLAANSNYGRALALFVRDHLASITRRTTVMVIGDGRNNYNPNNAWALEDIRRRCRRLVWICPEDRRNWGVGDSEMPAYARHCDRVAVVKSVSDLAGLADELLPA